MFDQVLNMIIESGCSRDCAIGILSSSSTMVISGTGRFLWRKIKKWSKSPELPISEFVLELVKALGRANEWKYRGSSFLGYMHEKTGIIITMLTYSRYIHPKFGSEANLYSNLNKREQKMVIEAYRTMEQSKATEQKKECELMITNLTSVLKSKEN